MAIADANTLLGLSGLTGCVAILIGYLARAGRVTGVFIVISAGLFGLALGLRAILSDLPIPAGLRFVAMAACGSLAFHRSCRWIQEQLTPEV